MMQVFLGYLFVLSTENDWKSLTSLIDWNHFIKLFIVFSNLTVTTQQTITLQYNCDTSEDYTCVAGFCNPISQLNSMY